MAFLQNPKSKVYVGLRVSQYPLKRVKLQNRSAFPYTTTLFLVRFFETVCPSVFPLTAWRLFFKGLQLSDVQGFEFIEKVQVANYNYESWI